MHGCCFTSIFLWGFFFCFVCLFVCLFLARRWNWQASWCFQHPVIFIQWAPSLYSEWHCHIKPTNPAEREERCFPFVLSSALLDCLCGIINTFLHILHWRHVNYSLQYLSHLIMWQISCFFSLKICYIYCGVWFKTVNVFFGIIIVI